MTQQHQNNYKELLSELDKTPALNDIDAIAKILIGLGESDKVLDFSEFLPSIGYLGMNLEKHVKELQDIIKPRLLKE